MRLGRGPGSGGVFRNLNELCVIDLASPPDAGNALVTIRSFGSVPQGVRGCAVAPVDARLVVEVLGERLGEPVGKRLGHDRRVVVVIALEPGGERVGADVGGWRGSTSPRFAAVSGATALRF